jgi:hypothetical protein
MYLAIANKICIIDFSVFSTSTRNGKTFIMKIDRKGFHH